METEIEKKMFEFYVSLGVSRSLYEVSNHFQVEYSYVREMSVSNRWHERVIEADYSQIKASANRPESVIKTAILGAAASSLKEISSGSESTSELIVDITRLIQAYSHLKEK